MREDGLRQGERERGSLTCLRDLPGCLGLVSTFLHSIQRGPLGDCGEHKVLELSSHTQSPSLPGSWNSARLGAETFLPCTVTTQMQ